MKILSIALAFTFVFMTANAQQAEREKAEKIQRYWREANLQFKDIEKYINAQNCAKNSQVFSGCFEAVNTLLSSSNEKTTFVLASTRADAWTPTVAKSFGTFELRNIDEKLFPKDMTLDERKAQKEKQDQEQAQIKSLYNNKDAVRDLLQAYEWAKTTVKEDKRSLSIGNALNLYYINGVDAHAHAHTLQEYQEMMNPEANTVRFFGIGTELTLGEQKQLIIARPLPGSPALAAGVQAGDVITSVNGEPVGTIENREIYENTIDKIRGPLDSIVTLTLNRKGKEISADIKRQPVSVDNIQLSVLKAQDGTKTIYLKLSHFMEDKLCANFLQKIVTAMRVEKTNNLIIDLRNNGGGLMDEALCMAGAFVREEGPLLKVWDLQQNAFVQTYNYREGRAPNISSLLKGKPILVLINAASASASEIFAGIVQDYGVGITVGERSYGKGTVQMPSTYKTATGVPLMFFRTIQRFHLPSERSNQISGITADVEVFIKPNPTEEDKVAMREADLYPHAVAAAQNEYQTPENIKAAASTCLDKTNPGAVYEKEKAELGFSDFQKLVALELTSCF